MPPRKRKVTLPDGNEHEAEVMTFQTGVEHFNEYLVDDGSVIQMKSVVTEILRLDGVYDQNGNPAYLLSSQQVTSVSSPDNLRRGGGQE